MQVSFDFTGARVFVFGGTSGINLGIAEGFSRNGATVGVASRSQEKVDATVVRLSELGPQASGYALDVRDAEAVAAALATFCEGDAPLDCLISGAAGNFPASAAGMSPNAFKAVVDIDLLGTYHVFRAGYQHLRKPGGTAIAISAPQAQVAMAMQSHVCAAKAGVELLTKSLALEWGCEGIRVNAVVPGPIAGTEGMARLAPTEKMQAAVDHSVPLRRQGTSDEIAQACLWLASDTAAYVSGAILPVDGGWLAAGVPLHLGD